MFDDTKTKKSNRLHALDDYTLALRQNRQAEQRKEAEEAGDVWQNQDLVFSTYTGGPLQHDNVACAWRKLLKKNNLERARPYDLRHTNISIDGDVGTNPRLIADMAGHASVETTLNVYTHTDLEAQRAAQTRFAERVS